MGALSSVYAHGSFDNGYGGPQGGVNSGNGYQTPPSGSIGYTPSDLPTTRTSPIAGRTPTYTDAQWANYGGGDNPRDGGYSAALTSAFNGLMASNAMQMAGFKNNVSAAQRQLLYQPALYNNSTASLRDAYNQGIAELNLNRMGNYADQVATARDATYGTDVYGNTQKSLRTAWDFANQQQGWATRDFLSDWDQVNARQAKAWEDYGIRDRGFEGQLADNAEGRRQREQQIREQLAGGGGGFTQGLRSDRTASDYAFDAGNRDVGLARDKSLSDYNFEQKNVAHDRTNLQTSYDRTIGGLDNDRNKINIDLERSGLDYEQQQAQIRDRMGQLHLAAARFNVDQNALSTNLQRQLERLGLENSLSTGQLLDAIRSGNTQQQQLANQIFAAAVAQTKR